MTIVTSSLSKSFVFKMFSVRTKTKSRSVFEMLPLKQISMDGRLNVAVEIKRRFQTPPVLRGPGLKDD